MLLEFKFKNFKTFKEETIFSMMPAPKIKDLDYSVLNTKIGKKQYKGLSSAVIYGPNAAGKTNIIAAVQTFKNIVLNGNINNEYNFPYGKEPSVKLELLPNIASTASEPVEFEITFIENNIIYKYGIKIDLGTFLSVNYDRRILKEYLYINEKMIFDRSETVEIGNINDISDMLVAAFDKATSKKMAENNLNTKELFLTSLFKSLYSAKISNNISEWFKQKCMVFLEANLTEVEPYIENAQINQAFMNKALGEAVEHFGVHGNKIVYMRQKEGDRMMPYSMLPNGVCIPVKMFESYGTERFLSVFSIIMDALQTGGTLIIDEFDASIHPMALMSIIGAFHNDNINKNGAQLIFNTHNPIFLNRNLFRRDEIKFVDRDDDNGISNHYSLSDFGTSGPNGVRNTEDYMRNYFVNRYGSIRNVDFSDILQEEMERVCSEKNI